MPLWITCLACFGAGVLVTGVVSFIFAAFLDKKNVADNNARIRENELLARRLEQEQRKARWRATK